MPGVAPLDSPYAPWEHGRGGDPMDVKRYVSRLLEDLAHVTGGEERDACGPAWLRGYVAGVAIAAQLALELEKEE